jgi:hypothetical protein
MSHINSWSKAKTDLQLLVNALDKDFSKNVDFSALSEIAFGNHSRTKTSWAYDTSQCTPDKALIFKNIDIGTNFLPHMDTISVYDIEVNLMVSISSNGHDPTKEFKDPIESLNVKIEIEGEVLDKNGVQIDVISSWHLDREKPSSQYAFIHPLYHLHFGGTSMRKRKGSPPKPPYDFGNLLLLNSPRIKHVPMDAVLATDFVIRNFYEKSKYTQLLRNNEYQIALRNAQLRYWKPYAVSFASKWIEASTSKSSSKSSNTSTCDELDIKFDFDQIFPTLL